MSVTKKISAAIVGGTGWLGAPVTRAFLDLVPESFNRVVVFTRDPNAEHATTLAKSGAELQPWNGTLTAEMIKGIDVIVSCLGRGSSLEEKDAVYKAAIASSDAKVYFPTEYGSDTRLTKANHINYNTKIQHAKNARQANAAAGGKVKIIQLYTGVFHDTLLTSFSGWDEENHRYVVLGSAKNKVVASSREDIGRSIARLSILATTEGVSVPDQVRVASDAASFNELAVIVGNATGKEVGVVEEPTEPPKPDEPEGKDMASFLRQVRRDLGSGAGDFSADNQNELVNPGGRYWGWTTIDDFVRRHK